MKWRGQGRNRILAAEASNAHSPGGVGWSPGGPLSMHEWAMRCTLAAGVPLAQEASAMVDHTAAEWTIGRPPQATSPPYAGHARRPLCSPVRVTLPARARFPEIVAPPVVVFRSVFRGRVNFATPGWLLEEATDHVVIATVPGAHTAQLAGARSMNLAMLAAGVEQVREIPWHTQRRVWLMPFGVAHAIGHFWDDATGEFLGHYINLQAPLQRTAIGFDSFDHVLDIVVDPAGVWHWKDEDELAEAVQLGIFNVDQAAAIRAEGERVIASFSWLLPTGWESWLPDLSWPALELPSDWRRLDFPSTA